MEGIVIAFSINAVLIAYMLLIQHTLIDAVPAIKAPSQIKVTSNYDRPKQDRKLEVEQVLPQLLNIPGPLIPPSISQSKVLTKSINKMKRFSKNFQSMRPEEVQLLVGIYSSLGAISASSFTYAGLDLKDKSWHLFQENDAGAIIPFSETIGASTFVNPNGEVFKAARLNCGPLLWYHSLNNEGQSAYLRLSYDLKLPILPLFLKLGCRFTFAATDSDYGDFPDLN